MDYSTSIASAIRQFLTEDDWHFSFDQEKGRFTFNLTLKNKLKKTAYTVVVHEKNYTVYATSPMNADDCLSEMAEFVCRANYGLRNGNFELDFRDGEIRYKSFVDCPDQAPDQEVVKNSIYVPAVMMNRYGGGIVNVMFGMQSAEEAVKACEAD